MVFEATLTHFPYHEYYPEYWECEITNFPQEFQEANPTCRALYGTSQESAGDAIDDLEEKLGSWLKRGQLKVIGN